MVRPRLRFARRVASPRTLTFALFLGAAVAAPGLCSASSSPPCTAAPYDCAAALVEQRDFANAITLLRSVLTPDANKSEGVESAGDCADRGREDRRRQCGVREGAGGRSPIPSGTKESRHQSVQSGPSRECRTPASASGDRRFDGDEVAHLYLAEIAVQRRACGKAIGHFAKAGHYAASRPEFIIAPRRLPPRDRSDRRRRRPARGAPAGRIGPALRCRRGARARQNNITDAARWFGALRSSYRDPPRLGTTSC